MPNKEHITDWFKSLQDDICTQLKSLDTFNDFREDIWEREGGGGGRTRIITGRVIEKGGVNFSAVHGDLPDKIASALKIDKAEFYATGVSIVLHPQNPYMPIIHMNVRYFEMSDGTWWFGGGIDLTPHYIIEEDARFFHQSLKEVCDKHGADLYPKFKEWADDYFYIKHRKETRGIGGIFFDRLSETQDFKKEDRFQFVQDVGNAFCPIYLHIAQKNRGRQFNEEDKEWQYLRRSRYVEFNLVWDKGTKFGLDTEGRTESILMSMPPQARWVYNHKTIPNSPEAKTLALLKKGIDWAADV